MGGFEGGKTYTLEEVDKLELAKTISMVTGIEDLNKLGKNFDLYFRNENNEYTNEIDYGVENLNFNLSETIGDYTYNLILRNIGFDEGLNNWFNSIDTISEYENFIFENSYLLPSYNESEYKTVEEYYNEMDSMNDFYLEDIDDYNSIEDSENNIDRFKNIAINELGNNEYDRTADKYWKEMGYPNRVSKGNKNAWCGMYISWVLKEAGYTNEKANPVAGSFIGINKVGYHVGIKVDGMLLSGNFRNKVGFGKPSRSSNVIGWRMPGEPNIIHREKTKFSDIPEGAIVVFDGSKSTK